MADHKMTPDEEATMTRALHRSVTIVDHKTCSICGVADPRVSLFTPTGAYMHEDAATCANKLVLELDGIRNQLRIAIDRAESAERKVEELRKVIEEAPHAADCHLNQELVAGCARDFRRCDCFKSKIGKGAG